MFVMLGANNAFNKSMNMRDGLQKYDMMVQRLAFMCSIFIMK